MNTNQKAPSCKHCGRLRKQLGADAERLALWCLACTTEKERSTGYCRVCYDKFAHVVCDNCAQTIGDPLHKHLCPDASCARVYYLCACCEPRLQLAKARLQCKACWLRTGEVALSAGVLPRSLQTIFVVAGHVIQDGFAAAIDVIVRTLTVSW